MPQEFIQWCDICWQDDVKTEAELNTIGVVIGGAKTPQPRTLLLCQEHTDEWLKPLTQLLHDYGVPLDPPRPGAKRPKAERATEESVSAGPAGNQLVRTQLMLEQNGTRKGKPPKGPRGLQCLWCPLSYSHNSSSGAGRHLRTSHGYDGITEAFGGLCPVCGEGDYTQMLSHTNKAHPELDFKSASDPFIWARDNGDPYGVYAAKLIQKPSLDPEKAWREQRDRENRERNHGN